MAEPVSSDVAPVAGRPPADAEAPGEAAAPPKQPRRRGLLDARTRFGIAYLVLAALVGAAVGLFIVFLGDPGPSASSWSSFRPKDGGAAAAAEIAHHVQGRYRLPSGDSLVTVIDRDPSLQSGGSTFPIAAVELEPAARGLSPSVYRTNHTFFYALCGLGTSPSCAIPGKPSVARLQLLRREILELSLYSFKYGGADAVVAYAPPTTSNGKTLRTIAFVRRDDWTPALHQPLTATLPSRPAATPGSLSVREQELSSAVRLYGYRFQPLGDGSLVLLASPLQG